MREMQRRIDALKTTRLRFEAMYDDYERESVGRKTLLAVDTCDVFQYMHINADRGLSMPQRAAKPLFEDETHERVLLPPHAYEVCVYISRVLQGVGRLSTGKGATARYMARFPQVSAFMEACETMKWVQAAKLWNTGVWRGIVNIARDQGRGASEVVSKPLNVLYQLIAEEAIKPIDGLGLGSWSLEDYPPNEEAVRRALNEFESIEDRIDRERNNMVDAQALGIAVGLNEHSLEHGFHCTMSTLSSHALTAYSRAMPDQKASICRNSFVSAYRKRLREFAEGRRDPLSYMKRGLELLDSVLSAYPVFDAKARRAPKHTPEVWMGFADAISTLRFMADYTEYYDKYFGRLIEPVTAVPPPLIETEELEEAYELLVDEGKFVSSLKTAHRAIMTDAKELTDKIRPYVVGKNGSFGEGLRIAGRSMEEMFDNVVRLIDEEGKEDEGLGRPSPA